jgi:hypothetical protein
MKAFVTFGVLAWQHFLTYNVVLKVYIVNVTLLWKKGTNLSGVSE